MFLLEPEAGLVRSATGPVVLAPTAASAAGRPAALGRSLRLCRLGQCAVLP